MGPIGRADASARLHSSVDGPRTSGRVCLKSETTGGLARGPRESAVHEFLTAGPVSSERPQLERRPTTPINRPHRGRLESRTPGRLHMPNQKIVSLAPRTETEHLPPFPPPAPETGRLFSLRLWS